MNRKKTGEQLTHRFVESSKRAGAQITEKQARTMAIKAEKINRINNKE